MVFSLRTRYSIRSSMVPIFSPCSRANTLEIRAPGHAAVLIENLDDHRCRAQPCQPRQVAAGFGMAGPNQHPARLRHEGKDVPGLHQIPGLGIGLDRSPHGGGPVRRRDAGGYALCRLDGNGEVGRVKGLVGIDHQRQPQLLASILGEGQADQTASVTRHEIDRLRGDRLGGHQQVAFVLPVLIIHDDNHLTLAYILDDFFGAVESHEPAVIPVELVTPALQWQHPAGRSGIVTDRSRLYKRGRHRVMGGSRPDQVLMKPCSASISWVIPEVPGTAARSPSRRRSR